MVLRKKVISVLAGLAVVVGLVLGGAVPANAAQGTIRNTGPQYALIQNGGTYTLPANGQAYYANFYRVPKGYCALSSTLGNWCPTGDNMWRRLPEGNHTIRVVYAQYV